uniref:Uncharacterized protein n=1 Tax=Physcomitrium patens TaxID=3218 RepID=A0A2K1KCH8_PHYPA|nr:hypothetical protein PHYPA_010636 [Physcomitrium patens]
MEGTTTVPETLLVCSSPDSHWNPLRSFSGSPFHVEYRLFLVFIPFLFLFFEVSMKKWFTIDKLGNKNFKIINLALETFNDKYLSTMTANNNNEVPDCQPVSRAGVQPNSRLFEVLDPISHQVSNQTWYSAMSEPLSSISALAEPSHLLLSTRNFHSISEVLLDRPCNASL